MPDGAVARPVRAYLASTPARMLALAAAIAGCVLLVVGIPGGEPVVQAPFDLEVYRFGGQALLTGKDIYGPMPETSRGLGLPFTYPPIAALLFAPMAMMPFWVAHLIFTAATYLGFLAVTGLTVRAVSSLRGADVWWVAVAASAVLLWLGPVRETVGYGQINVILMALVVVDILGGRGRWWQGSLIGLAMAVKLTPAVFLAYFLVRRDWRALATGIVSALAFTALGFLATWQGSLQYWGSTITDPSRIGHLYYVSNQSINGAFVRLGISDGGGPVWFAVCAAIGLGLLATMRRLTREGQDVAAMLAMAFFALVASPVSWSHHWVWVAPALIFVVARAVSTRSVGMWLLAGSGVFVFCSRLIWGMPHDDLDELGWAWWQQVLGNAQLIWGLFFLAALAMQAWRRPRVA